MEEAPLITQSLREAQKKEKIDRYPKVSLVHVHANITDSGSPAHVARTLNLLSLDFTITFWISLPVLI